ncbi:MAG TPA: hypothetical protein VF411_02395 [Bacteroidia bacterium]
MFIENIVISFKKITIYAKNNLLAFKLARVCGGLVGICVEKWKAGFELP